MSAGLQLAAELATRRRDAAVAVLARAREGERQARGQLQQLETYAGETESRWTLQAQVRASPELMQHHYQFMTRLYQAMQLQQNVLRQHAQQVETFTLQLRAAELRRESLLKVLARKHGEAALAQGRREQKEIDEYAAQQVRRLAAQRLEGAL